MFAKGLSAFSFLDVNWRAVPIQPKFVGIVDGGIESGSQLQKDILNRGHLILQNTAACIMTLGSTSVCIKVRTQFSRGTNFKLPDQSVQQSLALHNPAKLQGWESQQVQTCSRDISNQRWTMKSAAHLFDVQSECTHGPAGTSRPAQAAVWLSIL